MVFNREIESGIDQLFAPYNRPNSPGFAVGLIHQGAFIYRKGFGQANLEHNIPITADTVFDVGSMSKQFVGIAIALLEEAGQLSINDPMRTYLPEFPTYADQVTLAHLLHHTSGLRNYTVLAYYMIGCHESDAFTSEQIDDLLRNLKSLHFPPGERWEYSDSNYFLLAQIVDRVSGQTLGGYLRSHIFEPLGMDSTQIREVHSSIIRKRAASYVTHPIRFASPSNYSRQPSGRFYTLVSNYEHVGGEGLFTSLNDLYKWDRNFFENRLGQGKPTLIDRILEPGQLNSGQKTTYGFGLEIGQMRGKRFFGHDGAIHGYTSGMVHFPEEDLTLICLANQNVEGSWTLRARILDLIFPDITRRKPKPARSHPTLPAEKTQKYLGAYQNPETSSVWEIVQREGLTLAQINGEKEFEIIPSGPHTFQSLDSERRLEFTLDDTDSVSVLQVVRGTETFQFIPFLKRTPSDEALAQYAGEYHCAELATTFLIDVVEGQLRLRNKDRHFCSMDLLYKPTIRDYFRAYDPHPAISCIQFLRKGGQIYAFIYRDYDGDGREDFEFVRY
jgi:CubicO group peptidase (beta-lactamase class C family)